MTVIWEESALDELADIWLRADRSERRRITSAAAEIERRLNGDPKNEGESRSANRRILHAPPLGVVFVSRKHRKPCKCCEYGTSVAAPNNRLSGGRH